MKYRNISTEQINRTDVPPMGGGIIWNKTLNIVYKFFFYCIVGCLSTQDLNNLSMYSLIISIRLRKVLNHLIHKRLNYTLVSVLLDRPFFIDKTVEV
jgi:hypothetical protein